MERREMYKLHYEPMNDSEGAYIQVYDYNKVVVHNIRGYLPLKVRMLHFTIEYLTGFSCHINLFISTTLCVP